MGTNERKGGEFAFGRGLCARRHSAGLELMFGAVPFTRWLSLLLRKALSWFLLDSFAVFSGAHCVTHPQLSAQLGFVVLPVMEQRSGAARQACSLEENAL